ncbi:MAG: formylglycine-generating enzyme family protein [Candidatus Puniceispirillaceae bacterium]
MEADAASQSCCTPDRDAVAHDKAKASQGTSASAIITALAAHYKGHEIAELPAGEGIIGTDNAFLPVDEEGPARRVKLSSFQIDKTAVTNARFAAFVAETGYQTEAERLGDSFVFFGFLPPEKNPQNAVAAAPWWRAVKGACWYQPAGPDGALKAEPNHPVVHVSWHDAMAFAKWAGGRLPSEAEWEYAARGGRGNVTFPWGEQEPDEESFFPCNIWQGQFPNDNKAADGYFGTAPVDAFQPNDYGLYNMAGNVWEWTSQTFKVKSLKKTIKQAHLGKTGYKIVKGGSFLCHISYCYRYRIAARTSNSPDSSTSHMGIRLVYDEASTNAMKSGQASGS